jgi:hypothetical protein
LSNEVRKAVLAADSGATEILDSEQNCTPTEAARQAAKVRLQKAVYANIFDTFTRFATFNSALLGTAAK